MRVGIPLSMVTFRLHMINGGESSYRLRLKYENWLVEQGIPVPDIIEISDEDVYSDAPDVVRQNFKFYRWTVDFPDDNHAILFKLCWSDELNGYSDSDG